MIDDDPKTHRWPESPEDESSDTQSDDPDATRFPEMVDPFATIADAGVMTWADASGFVVGPVPTPPGTPRYRIIKAHARGALGEVFLARDEELKREVALKEIQEAYADDACSRARFILEAEVTGGLEHPGIVPVYGLGRHPDGRPYYAMRFVRGGSLKEAIDRYHRSAAEPKSDPGERTLEFRKLLARFLGVCNAIAYAHSRKILHRDLKPGNVMLGPYGETLVVDWGLAKSLAGTDEVDCVSDLQHPPGPLRSSEDDLSPSGTVMGAVVGTPAFMSPEQAEGDLDRLGPPSDIYSLGATLYYLLTGKVAFEGRDVAEILRRVREGDFPPPGRVRNGVPNALEAIALKAMALRAEDRYPNARALATDVEHWLAGASVSAYRDWYAVRVWRWFLSRPILATAGVACLFFDLCLLVILPLVYVQSVLHAPKMERLNLAVGVLVLTPFVGQLGALIGSSLGALVGLASRRTLAGLKRGASVGVRFGVPTALLALLASGAFEFARPPSWTNLASWIAPGGETGETWPRLPEALTRAPHWIKSTRAPAEIATFFDVPPRDDNSAPIYLEALLEFDDGMASCFSSGEGAWRGAKALARMGQLDKYEQASETNPRSVDNALDNLLEDYQVGFLKLRQAQRLHRCVFQTGFGDQVGLPHVRAAAEVERVTVLQVRRKLERGEIDLAINDLQVVFRLFRDIRSRGVISTQKSSLSLESAAETEILLPILQQPGLKGEHCDRLLSILEGQATDDTDPAREGFRAEYIRFGQILHAYLDPLIGGDHLEASADRGMFGSFFATSPSLTLDRATEKKLAGFLARTPPRDFAEAAHRAYDDFHRKIHAQTGKSLPERIEHAEQLAMPPRPHKSLELAPKGATFLKEVGKAEASRNAMKCLVALRRWELAGHSIGPDLNLEEIVRLAGIPRVPADPFRIDSGPLKFRLDQGTPIIESIGSEGQGREPLTFRLKPAVEAR
jgi:tRNA A-37 threonylcarbamoyl transferase component Bud32